MTALEISDLIAGQMSEPSFRLDRRSNSELSRALIPPVRTVVSVPGIGNGCQNQLLNLWLVLIEQGTTRGYRIVFDEVSGEFGLATAGFPGEHYLCLVGFYGDFLDAVRAM